MNITYEQNMGMALDFFHALMQEEAEKNPNFISKKKALARYKGLLNVWEKHGLVRAIPTENGKCELYPEGRLKILYINYEKTGRIIGK